jgi:hypothetical protein
MGGRWRLYRAVAKGRLWRWPKRTMMRREFPLSRPSTASQSIGYPRAGRLSPRSSSSSDLDEEGEQSWVFPTTEGLNDEELLGALTVRTELLRHELVDSYYDGKD